MARICSYYGVHSGSAFVLTNGIFATVGGRNESFFAKVEHIPVSGTHLDRVEVGKMPFVSVTDILELADRKMYEMKEERHRMRR